MPMTRNDKNARLRLCIIYTSTYITAEFWLLISMEAYYAEVQRRRFVCFFCAAKSPSKIHDRGHPPETVDGLIRQQTIRHAAARILQRKHDNAQPALKALR